MSEKKRLSRKDYDFVMEYLKTRLDDCNKAILRTEAMRCPPLESWCDKTIAHWESVAAALRWLIALLPEPGKECGCSSPDEEVDKCHQTP